MTKGLKEFRWYKMASFWDGPAKRVSELNNETDVLLRGVRYRAEITCSNCGKIIKADELRAKTALKEEVEKIISGIRHELAEIDTKEGIGYRATIALTECVERLQEAVDKKGADDMLDLTPELGCCVVPPSIGSSQAEGLRRMLEANHRMPLVLLTNNVHMVRLKEIPNHIARKIISEGAENEKRPERNATVVQLQKSGSNGTSQAISKKGQDFRAKNSE
jgi:hypothetical protein